MANDAAHVTITLNDGRALPVFVPHAVGSLEHPKKDAVLDRKFQDRVQPVLGADRAKTLVGIRRGLGEAADVRELVAMAP